MYRIGVKLLLTLVFSSPVFRTLGTEENVWQQSAFRYNPHYVLSLNLNEYAILNVSEMDGLQKYGGSGDFRLNMAKVGSNVVWNVTVDNPRLMELLGVFVGERTIKLVQSIKADALESDQRVALDCVKSLTAC